MVRCIEFLSAQPPVKKVRNMQNLDTVVCSSRGTAAVKMRISPSGSRTMRSDTLGG